ncbi:hypothetical protein DMA11_22305 [Marinilabiliaceae bacterium JC017]|nr:hypothetical protein DMA11_22305 [Marinilabiliaceae bacterium JC017]
MKRVLFLIIVVLSPIITEAQDNKTNFKFNGFFDTYHAMRSKDPHDFLSSRSRVRGELKKTHNKSSVFVSANINHNAILEDLSGFELREAFLDYTAENWSLRAGRQIIIWGAADGVRITDLISPMDLTEFLARDYDDIRMPVDAIKFRTFNQFMKLELVFVPLFTGFVLPVDPANPWALSLEDSAVKTKYAEGVVPSKTIDNSEFGGRLTFNLPGVDFSVAGLYTWDKMPVMNARMVNDTLCISPEHYRMTFLGGDVSVPLGNLVFRSELAYNFNKHFALQSLNGQLVKKNTCNYLVGVDWYPAGEWSVMMQYSSELIFDYIDAINNEEQTSLLTLNVAKKLMNSTLKLSDFTYYDLNYDGFYSRMAVDYSLSDQIHMLIGYDWFYGDKGKFGMYKDNSEIWVKAKYCF